MITARDLENSPRIRKFPLFDVLHPSTVHSQWNLILGFARDCAGVAADALAIIDNEAVFHLKAVSWKSADFAAI